MRRWELAFLMAGVVALPASAQNTVRWNDVVKSLEGADQEPPSVSVWLDRRIVNYGEPVRVGFRVEEDAFVVVARVDYDGRLTVLFPAGRSRAAEVKAGEDYYVRSARFGSAAAFIALERPGSTGYVFALASRTPMDLTRLTQRDFSTWVTGQQLTQPVSRYFGDPYRVVQRFARVVAFSENSEFDYDVEFYSVDRPMYVSAFSPAGCAFGAGLYGYGGRYYGTRLWNRGLIYDEFGTPSFASSCPPSSFSCLLPIFSLAYPFWVPVSYYCYNRPVQVAQGTPNGPTPPPVAPPLDANPVNPWAPDSAVKPPHLTAQDDDRQNGPHVMMGRPAPAASNDREDLSFAIPARALRRMRGVERNGAGSLPARAPDGSSGPLPMPGRSTPVTNDGPMEWVRPPRSFDAPPRDPVDRLPTRAARRESFGRDEGMPTRPGWGDFGGPPPRTNSPMFDRDPGRNMSIPQFHFNNGGMSSPGSGGMYTPPTRFEGRPGTSGGIMVNPGTATPPVAQPSSPAPPVPSSGSGSSSGSEKKPQ